MAALAKRFVPMVRRSVSDQTGLTGYFDAEFDFIAELPPPPPPPACRTPSAHPSCRSSRCCRNSSDSSWTRAAVPSKCS